VTLEKNARTRNREDREAIGLIQRHHNEERRGSRVLTGPRRIKPEMERAAEWEENGRELRERKNGEKECQEPTPKEEGA